MKKNISWWGLLIGAAIAYGLEYVIGGIAGDSLGLLGLILLALGVVNMIVAFVHWIRR